jgi:hypothetical protein
MTASVTAEPTDAVLPREGDHTDPPHRAVLRSVRA